MRATDIFKHGYGSKYLRSLAETYSFVLAFTFALFTLTPVYTQSETQAHSELVFQNEKLSTVLIELSAKKNLNFTFDANDPVYDKIINYSSGDDNIDKLLDHIFLNTGLGHKQIGNQIVLYHVADQQANADVSPPSEVAKKGIAVEKNNPVAESPIIIMEYKLDTIYLMDTIFRVDTIRYVDTVFIEKEKPEKPAQSKIKKIPVDFFQPGIEREKGWAMGVFVSPLLADFSLADGQKTFTLRSFSLGVDAIKLLDKWNFALGLRLTQFNQKVSHQYTKEEGGFYNTDTIDAYYTVTDLDTLWYYVTDSSWVPLTTQEYNYDQTNTLGYLEFNFSASFNVYKSVKTRIYMKAGGQISLLIYNNGIAIPDKNKGEGVDFKDLQFNTVNYSFLLGAGVKQKVADKVDFNTELYYSGYINSVVPDFPVNTNINALGLKLGFIFYLK